jgi:alkylation response protein AidB-like acyl-CoA dehydrogenase
MIDLRRTAEEDSLVAAVRAVATKMILPVAAHIDDRSELAPGIVAELHRMGLFHPVPEEYGGQGAMSPGTLLLVLEEIARADAGVAFAVAMSALPVAVVATLGSDELRRALLPVFAADPAQRFSTLLFEGFGRAPAEFATSAVVEPSSRCLVTGRKVAATWPGAAGHALAIAVDADSGELRACLLDQDAHVVVECDDQATGKLGLRSVPTGDVRLDGARGRVLPADDGDPSRLWRLVEHTRLGLAAVAVGIASAALDYAARYATERVAFGQPIAEYQGVSFPLAELDMRIDAARLDTWRTARDVDSATSATARGAQVSRAVWYAAEVAVEATRVAVNTLGGHGYLTDHPVERWYRAATTVSALCCDPLLLDLEVL